MKGQKISLLFLFILTGLVSVHARESDFGKISSITAFGFDPVTRFEGRVTAPGVSVSQEFYVRIVKNIQAGMGFKYLLPRETEKEKLLNWQSFYGSVKLFIPTSDLPFYVKAAAGYCFIQGNESFKNDYSNLGGGFYYFLGGGVDMPFYYSSSVRFSFIFDMGYSSYMADAKQGSADLTLHYLTLDMMTGIGLKF